MEMVRLSAPHTGRLYPPGDSPGTHFCQRRSRPRGVILRPEGLIQRNISMTLLGIEPKNPPACSAVAQQIAPTCASYLE